MQKRIQTSKNPEQDLKLVSYTGQPPFMRQYLSGYESYLESMPVIQNSSIDTDVQMSDSIMKSLANVLVNRFWTKKKIEDNKFERTIIAMENPYQDDGSIKEGRELLVAQWGKGFKSPVHGHANGLLHETLLNGKMIVNTYRITDEKNAIVRPLKSEMFHQIGNEPVEILSEYRNTKSLQPRPNIVHNFEVLESSASLHYVGEHTRDGRDNTFTVEQFDDIWNVTHCVNRITSKEALYSRVGDVILVRSSNVPEWEDHYIVITGGPVVKPHGIRPQEIVIKTSRSKVLDQYEMKMGLTLLKLTDYARDIFFKFHGFELKNGQVITPEV